jgi:DinB superfamily
MTDIEIRRHHCPICSETVDVPTDVFAALAEMPQRLREALRTAPDRSSDGWSPGFIAVHLADLEVSRGWRTRRVLTEDNPHIEPLDQNALAERLRYDERDIDLALETFAANRAANLELLRLAGDAGLARTYKHPDFGQLTLGILMNHTADHDVAHLRQIAGR